MSDYMPVDVRVIIGGDPDNICAICIDGLDYSKATLYPCLHAFHIHCYEEWRQVLEESSLQATCPLCRANIYDVEV